MSEHTAVPLARVHFYSFSQPVASISPLVN